MYQAESRVTDLWNILKQNDFVTTKVVYSLQDYNTTILQIIAFISNLLNFISLHKNE